MQSVLPLEVKTLKHKTADQVPADRRFAFYLRFFASTAMSRLRNVRTTSMIFVKEYFRCFALLSFCSKKFSLCIFIALIALTIALNLPIILDGVSLKLHSVAKSIMPLRMGSRVRIPHRTAAVLAERLSRPIGVSHWGVSSGKARASAVKPESEYILFAAIKGLPGLGRAVFSVPKYPVPPDGGGLVWRAQSTVPTEKDCRCSAFCRLAHQTKGGTTE